MFKTSNNIIIKNIKNVNKLKNIINKKINYKKTFDIGETVGTDPDLTNKNQNTYVNVEENFNLSYKNEKYQLLLECINNKCIDSLEDLLDNNFIYSIISNYLMNYIIKKVYEKENKDLDPIYAALNSKGFLVKLLLNYKLDKKDFLIFLFDILQNKKSNLIIDNKDILNIDITKSEKYQQYKLYFELLESELKRYFNIDFKDISTELKNKQENKEKQKLIKKVNKKIETIQNNIEYFNNLDINNITDIKKIDYLIKGKLYRFKKYLKELDLRKYRNQPEIKEIIKDFKNQNKKLNRYIENIKNKLYARKKELKQLQKQKENQKSKEINLLDFKKLNHFSFSLLNNQSKKLNIIDINLNFNQLKKLNNDFKIDPFLVETFKHLNNQNTKLNILETNNYKKQHYQDLILNILNNNYQKLDNNLNINLDLKRFKKLNNLDLKIKNIEIKKILLNDIAELKKLIKIFQKKENFLKKYININNKINEKEQNIMELIYKIENYYKLFEYKTKLINLIKYTNKIKSVENEIIETLQNIYQITNDKKILLIIDKMNKLDLMKNENKKIIKNEIEKLIKSKKLRIKSNLKLG